MGKILKPDYSMNSKLLKFWRQVHAEMLHEGSKQIFRTWIMKDWEQEGQAHTLFLENYWQNINKNQKQKQKSDFIFLFLQSWKKKKFTTQSKALLEVKAVGEGFYIHGKRHELQTKHWKN